MPETTQRMSNWFSLPLPRPNPTTERDDSSTSETDWLLNRNFKNRLHFEAWSVLDKSIVSVKRDLEKLDPKSRERIDIFHLLKPVQEELLDRERYGCWNEAAIETQISAPVLRAVNVARKALQSIRNEDEGSGSMYFLPQRQVRSEQYVGRVGRDLGKTVKVSNPEHIIPDICCFIRASDATNGKSPLATIELKGPRSRFIHDNEDGSKAKIVADYCQYVFDKRPVKNVLRDHFNITKRLSQALTQTFHTESGSGALYNHVHALFFYIGGKKKFPDGRTRVVIKVSRLYRCDERVSNLHALTAWSLALKQLEALREQGNYRKGQLLDAIEFVSTSSREHEEDDDCPPSSSSEEPKSPSQTSSRGSRSPDKKRKKGNSDKNNNSTESGSSSKSKRKACGTFIEYSTISGATVSKNHLESFEVFLASSCVSDAKLLIESFRDDKAINCAMECDLEILGEGAFGFVRRAYIGDTEVALKYANRWVGGLQQYLYNEILIYCYVASRYPHVLNYSIPRVVAVGFHNWAGPVLATEIVGKDVILEGGSLKIGRERVHSERSLIVCRAAMDCLKALHDCGILHRDVALRNLRVCFGENGSLRNKPPQTRDRCSVWWIDLGLSKIGGSRDEFDLEMRQCISLFPSPPEHFSKNSRACLTV